MITLKTARRKHPFRLVYICIAILLAAYVTYAYWQQPVALAATNTTLASPKPASSPTLAWPSTGEAAVGAVGYGVLAQHSSDKPLATASTIKLLTALAVLQMKPLNDNSQGPAITLTQADVDSYTKYVAEDGSVVRVTLGEQLTERQALEALLLPSANNIAETLARWAFGSIDTYLTYANDYAKQIGMSNTTVTDPSGFLGTTTSTPRDLTLLGETAIAQPTIAQIVREPNAVIPVQGEIQNVDILLGNDGIIGLKTGNNNQDLGCFVFADAVTIGDTHLTIVGAVMGAPSLGTALWSALPLINSVRAGFHEITVAAAGADVKMVHLPWSDTASLLAKTNLSLVVWGSSSIKVFLHVQMLRAPIRSGSIVGSLKALDTLNDQQVTVPLVLQEPLYKPDLLWRLLHPSW